MESVLEPLKEFSKNSIRLVKRCTKPDRREFNKICLQTALGFIVMGFIGFFVKLVFIAVQLYDQGGPSRRNCVGEEWKSLSYRAVCYAQQERLHRQMGPHAVLQRGASAKEMSAQGTQELHGWQ